MYHVLNNRATREGLLFQELGCRSPLDFLAIYENVRPSSPKDQSLFPRNLSNLLDQLPGSIAYHPNQFVLDTKANGV